MAMACRPMRSIFPVPNRFRTAPRRRSQRKLEHLAPESARMARMKTGPACPARSAIAVRTVLAASLADGHGACATRSSTPHPDYPPIPLAMAAALRAQRTGHSAARAHRGDAHCRLRPAGSGLSAGNPDWSATARTTIRPVACARESARPQAATTIDLSTLTCSHISLSQGALKVELDDLTLRGPGARRPHPRRRRP